MWYVIQVPTGREEELLQQCRRKVTRSSCNELFVPCYMRKRKYKQTWTEQKAVLFPGYLFADTDTPDALILELQKVQNMTKVLGADHTPVPVSEPEQQWLESIMEADHIVQMSIGYQIGEQVSILSGPLQKKQGIIRSINRHKRIAVLGVELFGREMPMEVGLEVIHKVDQDTFDRWKEESIREAEEHGMFTEQYVRVLDGVFAGMTGRVIAINPDAGEADVELTLDGTAFRVTFLRSSLQNRS